MQLEHDIAVVCADTAGKWPMLDSVTTDFGYVRLHGAEELYVSGYDDKSLDAWAFATFCRGASGEAAHGSVSQSSLLRATRAVRSGLNDMTAILGTFLPCKTRLPRQWRGPLSLNSSRKRVNAGLNERRA